MFTLSGVSVVERKDQMTGNKGKMVFLSISIHTVLHVHIFWQSQVNRMAKLNENETFERNRVEIFKNAMYHTVVNFALKQQTLI